MWEKSGKLEENKIHGSCCLDEIGRGLCPLKYHPQQEAGTRVELDLDLDLGLLQYWAERRQPKDTHPLLLLASPSFSSTPTNVTRDNDGAPGQGSLAEMSSPAACRQDNWIHSRCCHYMDKKSSSTQRHSLAAGTPSTNCHASRKGLPRWW